MKKFITIIFFAVMALSFVACSTNFPLKDNHQKQTSVKNDQIANPYANCKTIADAEKLAGFNVTVPENISEGYIQKLIQVIEKDMVQIFYENGDKKILIRKARGNENISGDYNEYKENNAVIVGNRKVLTRGNDGKVNTAAWVDGEYNYSITANLEKTGLEATTINDIVSSIR